MRVSEYLRRAVSCIDMMQPEDGACNLTGVRAVGDRRGLRVAFSFMLNWPAFSVRAGGRAGHTDLTRIFTAVSPWQYIRLQRRARMVRRHFMVNIRPWRFNVFHTILHSIWLRRHNVCGFMERTETQSEIFLSSFVF